MSTTFLAGHFERIKTAMDPFGDSEFWVVHVSAKEAHLAEDLGFKKHLLENNTGSSILQDEVRRLRHLHEETTRYKSELVQKYKKLVEETGGMPKDSMFESLEEFEKSMA